MEIENLKINQLITQKELNNLIDKNYFLDIDTIKENGFLIRDENEEGEILVELIKVNDNYKITYIL